jgi:imidazolonepropionase-like amidohydrolase
VIAPGAHADILAWDGDPETDLGFLDDPASNLRLVMKGGRVFKETLA